MKNTVVISIVIMLVVFLLSFSFLFNKRNVEKYTINIWTVDLKYRFDKYMEYIIDKFEKNTHNVIVKWNDYPEDKIISKLYEAWHQNTLPDIISLNTNNLINKLNEELILDLNGFNTNFSDIFFEGILNSNIKNNKLLGIPWYTTIDVLYVNKDIMKSSNILEDVYPKVEEEFLNLLRNIKEESKKYGSVFAPETIRDLVFNGFNILNENGNVFINTKEVIDYFKKKQIQFEHLIVPKKFLNFDDKLYLYSNGEVGMIKANVKFIDNMEKISKEIYNGTSILPIPLGKNGERYSNTMSLSILKASKNYNIAMDFINFLVDESNQRELINNFNVLPVNKNIDVDNIFLHDNSKKAQAKIVAFKSLEKSRDFIFNIKNYDEIDNIIGKYSRSIYLEGKDVEKMINEAQDSINHFTKEIGDNGYEFKEHN